METLKVPYQSQVTAGATEHRNDCGAAALLMIIQAYNLAKDKTVDQIYNQIQPVGDLALSATAMRALLLNPYKIPSDWMGNLSLSNVFSTLSENKPSIALIHYAPLVDAGLTQFTGFRGAHFVVIVGIDILNVAIQDPYRSDGKTVIDVKHSIFNTAWNEASLDSNPPYCALTPRISISDLSVPIPVGTRYRMVVNGVNVRSGPSAAYPVIRNLWKTTSPIVTITEVVTNYGKLVEGGWVYVGTNPTLFTKVV